jgi:hypothetical protein
MERTRTSLRFPTIAAYFSKVEWMNNVNEIQLAGIVAKVKVATI